MSRNPFTGLTAQEMARSIAACMPAGEPNWRRRLAESLEEAAETDDLSLLRAGKQMDEGEAGFQAFLAVFPDAEPGRPMPTAHYDAAVALARIDRDLRRKVLLAYAAELRKR
jgi:hypothetical protein